MSMNNNKQVTIDDIYSHGFWRHRIILDEDHFTPGYRRDRSKWEAYYLPDDMSAKTFLDVGASDGLFSFEAERRGAKRVLATDLWELAGDDRWQEGVPIVNQSKQALNLVRDYLNSDVEIKTIDIMDISPESVGKFDIVLCSGVLQSIRDPYTAIENLLSVTNEMLVVKNNISLNLSGGPGMEFVPQSKPQIWYPNRSGFKQMFSHLGHDDLLLLDPKNIDSPSELPQIREAETKARTSIYNEPSLDSKTAVIEPDSRVKILCEKNEKYRIHYRKCNQTAPIQGWIEMSRVTHADPQETKNLIMKGLDTVYKEGIISFGRKGFQFTLRKAGLRQENGNRDLVIKCEI